MYFVAKPIVTNGLILNLDAGNTLCCTSGSSTWRNLANTSQTGSFVGLTSFQTNPPSLYFSGSNNYARIPNPFSGISYFSYTADFWMNGIDKNVTQFILTGIGYGGIQSNVPPIYSSYFPLVYTTPSDFIYGTETILDRGIVNFTVTVQHTGTVLNHQIYINGKLNTSNSKSTTTGIYTETNLSIGGNTVFTNTYFYNFKMYNRALSSSEITQNFNALKGRYGL
jgi:hypothetical protein